ncbi:type-F conjugative transfer system pilin chaperone TraQ [Escherichia coli]
MISKCRFSLPRLDITGMWVFALGVWFHIVARLVYSKPWMAFFFSGGVDCGHPCAVRRIPVLDAWIARVSRKSVRHWKPGNRP